MIPKVSYLVCRPGDAGEQKCGSLSVVAGIVLVETGQAQLTE